ncbi:MAG: helix-turn-helix domain-containing protein, partial [Candidatus Aminicenantes bacterium]
MQLQTILPERKFKILSSKYTAKTGLPLVLMNTRGEIIHSGKKCTMCEQALISSNSVLMNNCRLKMLNAIEEAFRWGEGYITNCPIGLIMFAVPIVLDQRLVGGFLSGFAIFPEMRQDFKDEIIQNLRGFDEVVDESKLGSIKLKFFSLKKVRDNVAYLLALTRQFQITDMNFLEDRKAKYIQQYKIANFLDELKKNKPDVARKILDKQEEIIKKVKLGDKTGAREILNEFLGTIFFESGMNFEIIKVRVIELVVIISRTAIEAGVDAKDLMGLNYSYFTELNKTTDLDELLLKLNDILTNFINRVSVTKEKKKKIKIGKMIEYINQNFTRKIKSEEVAKAGGLSTSRCLHLFKEETGMSLSEYVKKLRIDYGKYLLLNTDISIADCSIEAGFFDQSHFTKTFKQVEKITPSQFRRKYKKW